jgi:hypothetical protein
MSADSLGLISSNAAILKTPAIPNSIPMIATNISEPAANLGDIVRRQFRVFFDAIAEI